MIDWLHGLPFSWLIVVVFGATYLVAAAIAWAVLKLAVGKTAGAFKAVSPGLLPPLGVVFGLLVGFLAVKSGMTLVKRRQRSIARPAHCAPSYSSVRVSPEPSRPGCACWWAGTSRKL